MNVKLKGEPVAKPLCEMKGGDVFFLFGDLRMPHNLYWKAATGQVFLLTTGTLIECLDASKFVTPVYGDFVEGGA